jgi:hypothetical protein
MQVGDLIDEEQLVRVGSLVMWNREESQDYGCMGVVVAHEFRQDTTNEKNYSSFAVLWSDNDQCEYDYGDLWRSHIKVVKF